MVKEVTINDAWRADAHRWEMPDCPLCHADGSVYRKGCWGCRVRDTAKGTPKSAQQYLKAVRDNEGLEVARTLKRHVIEYRVAHGWMDRPKDAEG